MSKDTIITAGTVLLFTLVMLAMGFVAGRQSVNKPVGGHLQLLIAELDSLTAANDSLDALAVGYREEAEFWAIQAAITNELLEQNADSLQAFYNNQNQRNEIRAKISVAGAAELDSFFSARYTTR